MAREIGSNEFTVRRIVSRTGVVSSGIHLQQLLRYIEDSVGHQGLRKRIHEATFDLAGKLRSLSLYDEEIIRFVFDLFATFALHEATLNVNEFSDMFETHRNTIANVLNISKKGFTALNNESVRSDILDILTSDQWDARLADMKQANRAAIERLSTQFVKLINQLQPRFKTKIELATALGVHTTTLLNATQRSTNAKTLTDLISKAEQLLAAETATDVSTEEVAPIAEQSVPATPTPKLVTTPSPPAGTQRPETDARRERAAALIAQLQSLYKNRTVLAEALSLSSYRRLSDFRRGRASDTAYEQFFARAKNLLAQGESVDPPVLTERVPTPQTPVQSVTLASHGGGPSPLGIPYALTEESFTEIKGMSDGTLEKLLDTAVTQIRLTRGLLNICSQMINQTTQAAVRQRLGRELAELNLSIRTVGYALPDSLLKMYDAQRAAWVKEIDRGIAPATKRKRKPRTRRTRRSS